MQYTIQFVNSENKDDFYIDCSQFGKTATVQDQDNIVCLVGTGDKVLTPEAIRLLGGFAKNELNQLSDGQAVVDVSRLNSAENDHVLMHFLTGWYLASYQFANYKSKKVSLPAIEITTVDSDFELANQTALNHANAINFARDLCNEPSNKLTPALYAEKLKAEFEDTDVQVEIIEGLTLSESEFAGIHAVAKGSVHAPKLVVLTLLRNLDTEPVALVGKGVTFDSGGVNVKTMRDISDMKMDMGGSAAVAGTMKLLAASDDDVNVTAILPLVQNLSDGNSMLPSDIIEYANGFTVEVGNTDAEGRLILADGILHAKQLGIKKVIDIATLTGSAVRALGTKAAGIFSNDEEKLWAYKKLGDISGDYVWPLPIYEEYISQLHSDVADINNMNQTPLAGATAAAIFLQQFTEGIEDWTHIDMAGTMTPHKVHSYYKKGASGYGVRLLYELIKAKNKTS